MHLINIIIFFKVYSYLHRSNVRSGCCILQSIPHASASNVSTSLRALLKLRFDVAFKCSSDFMEFSSQKNLNLLVAVFLQECSSVLTIYNLDSNNTV